MPEETAPSRGRLLLQFVLSIVVGGALVAALLAPVLLGPGVAVGRLADLQTQVLPAASVSHVEQPLPGNTRVLAADGSLITEFYDRNRMVVAADQIAPVMRQAQIDIEDARFYQHGAIDLTGTLRAMLTDVRSGGTQQGGSTLTQQLVKQTLVQSATTPAQQQAATAESLGRKITEARLAVKLDEQFSKDEILLRYLNTVYYGHGAYGVQAAAQTYFSTDAAHLTIAQAATLAGLVQNPTADDPIDHPEAGLQRRNEVLDRMSSLGHLSASDLAAAKAEPIGVKPGPVPPQGCANAPLGAFFCTYLEHYLTTNLHLSDAQLRDGGLTIKTTMRPDMQQAGDRAVAATLPVSDPRAGIYTAMQPGTGHVLAISVNRNFGCNGAGCTSVDLGLAAGQGSGSTYKLFTAAYALQHGYSMRFTQTTSDPYVSKVFKNGSGPYVVRNAGTYPPTLDLADALVMSSNTFFVGLEDHLGSVEGPVHTAQQMGLFSLSNDEAQKIIAEQRGSFTLGAESTSPLALTTAYATVFAAGKSCQPTPVTAVLDASGQPLTGSDGNPLDLGDHCTPNALPPAVANTLAQVLRGDVQSPIGTATRANIPGHDISGKTGTSESNFSVAFVGSTPEYTAGVMVYNPDENQNVGGFGGDKGAQIWHDAMAPILAGQPTAAMPPADRSLLGVPPGGPCPFAESSLRLTC